MMPNSTVSSCLRHDGKVRNKQNTLSNELRSCSHTFRHHVKIFGVEECLIQSQAIRLAIIVARPWSQPCNQKRKHNASGHSVILLLILRRQPLRGANTLQILKFHERFHTEFLNELGTARRVVLRVDHAVCLQESHNLTRRCTQKTRMSAQHTCTADFS